MTGIGVRVGLSVSLDLDEHEVRPAPEWVGPPPIGPDGMPARVVTRPSRLTEIVVPAEMTGGEADAALRDVRLIRAKLAAFEAAVVERKDQLRPQQVILPGARTGNGSDVVGELGADPAPDTVDDWLPDELGVVLGTGPATASYLLERSLVLTRQLPATWAALADGLIDEGRARMIVDVLRHQKASFAGPVADPVVDAVEAQALAWARAGVLPTPLRERVAGALIAAAEGAADRRRKLRQRGSNVIMRSTGDGLADLVITDIPAEDAAAAIATVESYARQWQTDGDARPIGQLRSSTATQFLTQPWRQPAGHPPVGAQLHIRVDLDDLVGATPPAPHREPPPAQEAGSAPPPGEDAPDSAPPDDPAANRLSPDRTAPTSTAPDDTAPDGCAGGSGRPPTVDGHPITPAAVTALLARLAVLDLGTPPGGSITLEICAAGTGEQKAAVTLRELQAAARAGTGLGPPPARDGYTPSTAQRRFMRARDQHCRFPGCRRPARFCDADHVCAYDCGGATDCPNLCTLCRRHHRLKTHATGWAFRMDPDGVLHVTTPTGITRTTRPPAMDDPVVTDPDDDPPPF